MKISDSFLYNHETGLIKRINRKNADGSYDNDGYLILKFKGKQYKAHRIAWFLYYGEMPKNVINHINGDRADNRIKNLEDVTQAVNSKKGNYKKNKETGEKGIYIDRTKGLKKKFAFKMDKKTYRSYTLKQALLLKKLKFYETTRKVEQNSTGAKSSKRTI